jgi:hypothetical protein
MGRRHHPFRSIHLMVILIAVAVCPSHILNATPGKQAAIVDLGGVPVDPFQSARGRVTVLVFVRTDCPISNRYAPTIQRLSMRYADKASFWLVYPARNESAEMIRKHEQEFGYKLPVARDLQHVLVKQSHAAITPEAAVFDAKRHLIYHGRIDDLYEDFGRARRAPTTNELEDAIQAALDGKAPALDAVPAVGCYISDLE